ncbi:hypothetical protein GCM10022275_22650 [Tessaracoccus defluvii]
MATVELAHRTTHSRPNRSGRGAIRTRYTPADVNAAIGFSAHSATVANAASQRLEKRRITNHEREALVEMATLLDDLSSYIAEGDRPARRAPSSFSFLRLNTLTPSLLAQADDSKRSMSGSEASESLRNLVRDLRVVADWHRPNRSAAQRVSAIFSQYAEELLAGVSQPPETRRVAG